MKSLRQLRRTNTDPYISVPDQNGTVNNSVESQDVENKTGKAILEGSNYKKDSPRRRHRSSHSQNEVNDRSRGTPVPQVSLTSKTPTTEKVQSSKNTKPKCSSG